MQKNEMQIRGVEFKTPYDAPAKQYTNKNLDFRDFGTNSNDTQGVSCCPSLALIVERLLNQCVSFLY